MRDVYIIGTGIHPWGGFSEKVFADFAAVAVNGALKDANVEWKRIQAIMAGIFIYGGNAGHLSGQYLESIFGETGVPVVDTRRANTSLLLKDGQIVIMGGLRRQEKTKQVHQIPILGDLPIVGELFKSTNIVTNNSELIVIAAPHVYKDERISDAAMAKYNQIKNRPMLSVQREHEKQRENQAEQFDE